MVELTEQEKQIFDMIGKESVKEIARHFKVDPQKVYRIAYSQGIKIRRLKKKPEVSKPIEPVYAGWNAPVPTPPTPILNEVQAALLRLDSAIRVIKESIKGTEIALRSIDKRLQEPGAQRELAIAEEQKRAREREPKKHERMRPRR